MTEEVNRLLWAAVENLREAQKILIDKDAVESVIDAAKELLIDEDA